MTQPPIFTLLDPDSDGYRYETRTTDGQLATCFVTTHQLIIGAAHRGARAQCKDT